MGATLFTMKEIGNNVENVFKSLVEEARYMYGDDPYSGSIATTSLGHEIIPDKKLEKALQKGDWKTIEDYTDTLYTEKRYTNYIKKVKHYEGFTPKWVNDKETVTRKKGVRNIAKFTIVLKSQLNRLSRWARTYETLTEAKREAKALALREGESVVILQYRSNGETFQIGRMNLESDGKQYKSKRTAKTKVYLPVYEIEFFVAATK